MRRDAPNPAMGVRCSPSSPQERCSLREGNVHIHRDCFAFASTKEAVAAAPQGTRCSAQRNLRPQQDLCSTGSTNPPQRRDQGSSSAKQLPSLAGPHQARSTHPPYWGSCTLPQPVLTHCTPQGYTSTTFDAPGRSSRLKGCKGDSGELMPKPKRASISISHRPQRGVPSSQFPPAAPQSPTAAPPGPCCPIERVPTAQHCHRHEGSPRPHLPVPLPGSP